MNEIAWTYVISKAGTLLTGLYICKRAINHNGAYIQHALLILWCIIWTLFFAIEPIAPLIIRIVYCASSIVLIWKLLKIKIDTILPAFLLSYGISYLLYSISVFIVSFIVAPFISAGLNDYSLKDFSEPIYLLFFTAIAGLQFLIAYLFLKMRRFKFGFPFLSERYAMIAALIIAGTILLIGSYITSQGEDPGTVYIILIFIVGTTITSTGIYIWIRRSVSLNHLRMSWERNEELHVQKIDELTSQIQFYKEKQKAVMIANHKIIQRLTASERDFLILYKEVLDYVPDDISEKLTAKLDKIRELSQEYYESINIIKDKKPPSSEIKEIDDMFALYLERFTNNDIEFVLKVSGSVKYMVENIIKQSKLETMIGDHLQDAFNAVNANIGSERRIVLSMIGKIEGCYEFSVHDSGIPFEADTLIRLGTERVTTRAEDGGSGIGFMTTFETMRECGASLVIRENVPGSAFTKKVTIRFDGKNKYIIETYRPGSFPKSDRYTVIGYR